MQRLIIGIDEVGRGCWAGPLVVGAVILNELVVGITDSKALSKTKRETYAEQIKAKALLCNTGWVWPNEINEIGLTAATTLAIERALHQVTQYDKIIIDGSINYLPNNHKAYCLIKADLTIPSVSAASIVAKVARDQYMFDQDSVYIGYKFGQHVGYGTAVHKQAIIELGITPLHRLSYKPIQRILNGSDDDND